MSKYVLRNTPDEQFVFSLLAGNHEILLTSEVYKTKQGALNAIEAVKNNAPEDNRYDRTKTANGKHTFTLRAANGEVIGRSELYSSSAARDVGIESVKRNAPVASVDDDTSALFASVYFDSGNSPTEEQTAEAEGGDEPQRTKDGAVKYSTSGLGSVESGSMPELELYVDPGSAPPEAIAEFLVLLSDVYRVVGGTGITFTPQDVRSANGVVS